MIEFFERADRALYKAKEQGKDCWSISKNFNQPAK